MRNINHNNVNKSNNKNTANCHRSNGFSLNHWHDAQIPDLFVIVDFLSDIESILVQRHLK